MLIKKLNAMFVHIPRTGGTSICNFLVAKGYVDRQPLKIADLDSFYGVLKLNNNVYELDHLFSAHLTQFLSQQIITNLKFFSVVRDPVERIVSVYKRAAKENDFRSLAQRSKNGKITSFSDFLDSLEVIKSEGLFEIENLTELPHFHFAHFFPQSLYLFDAKGGKLVNNIYSIRKLDSLVSDMLGSSYPQQIALPHDNQSSSNIVITNDDIVEQTNRIKKIYEVDYHKLSEYF